MSGEHPPVFCYKMIIKRIYIRHHTTKFKIFGGASEVHISPPGRQQGPGAEGSEVGLALPEQGRYRLTVRL